MKDIIQNIYHAVSDPYGHLNLDVSIRTENHALIYSYALEYLPSKDKKQFALSGKDSSLYGAFRAFKNNAIELSKAMEDSKSNSSRIEEIISMLNKVEIPGDM